MDLEQRIKELESDVAHWQQNFDDERHAYFRMLARVKELEEAIRKHRDRDDRYIMGDRELYAVLDKTTST